MNERAVEVGLDDETADDNPEHQGSNQDVADRFAVKLFNNNFGDKTHAHFLL
jgi:hypothetical protein